MDIFYFVDVSPPKSPTPDMDQPTVSSSNSSSVELLPEEMDTENNHFASELAQHIGDMTWKPGKMTEKFFFKLLYKYILEFYVLFSATSQLPSFSLLKADIEILIFFNSKT